MAAYYRQGETLMIDYTPGSDVSAGDIVLVGAEQCVVHTDSASGVLNAVSFPNENAVYEVDKETLTDTYAVGAKVDAQNSTSEAMLTTAGDAHLGVCVKASGASDPTVWVKLTSS